MRKLSTRERVLLAILVVVAVVSGYVLLFSMPLNEKIQTLGQEIMESEDLKTQLESRWSQQQRLQQLTEQLKKQEGEARYMPEYDNLQAVMVELNTILADCQEYSWPFSRMTRKMPSTPARPPSLLPAAAMTRRGMSSSGCTTALCGI